METKTIGNRLHVVTWILILSYIGICLLDTNCSKSISISNFLTATTSLTCLILKRRSCYAVATLVQLCCLIVNLYDQIPYTIFFIASLTIRTFHLYVMMRLFFQPHGKRVHDGV